MEEHYSQILCLVTFRFQQYCPADSQDNVYLFKLELKFQQYCPADSQDNVYLFKLELKRC